MIVQMNSAALWVVKALNDPDVPNIDAFGAHLAYAITGPDGEFLGGVIYSGWMPTSGSINMTIATKSPRWATRAHIRMLLQIAFDGIKAKRVTALVRDGNVKSKRLLEGLGFVLDCHIRGTDRLLFGLLRSDAARWLDQDTVYTAKVTPNSRRQAKCRAAEKAEAAA